MADPRSALDGIHAVVSFTELRTASLIDTPAVLVADLTVAPQYKNTNKRSTIHFARERPAKSSQKSYCVAAHSQVVDYSGHRNGLRYVREVAKNYVSGC